jgi:hypothetical protein
MGDDTPDTTMGSFFNFLKAPSVVDRKKVNKDEENFQNRIEYTLFILPEGD